MKSSAFPHRHTIGVTRRELLQVGYSGLLGLGLPAVVAGRSAAAAKHGVRKAKSVLLVFLTGAPSHLDTFDPKPEAPPEIRGEFRTIPTTVAGLRVCEHLPRLAVRAHQYALVRSFSHRENNHLVATHHVLTGHPQPRAFFDRVASRTDWPCYAGAVSYFRPRHDGIPGGVHLPTFLVEGPLTWPGQHAGLLGPQYDPWQLNRDPNAQDFRVDAIRPGPGMEATRLQGRRSLLRDVDHQRRELEVTAAGRRLSDQQDQAFSMLTSGRVARAFQLDREPPAVRERYGRHAFGQSLLLARRLIQAGVPVVQANMGRVQNWDLHTHVFPGLKGWLLPPLDKAVSALLDDLSASGLLDETLVVLLGEFGRAPKITMFPGAKVVGRDHWAPCFFGLFAGAGVRGGQVIGKSDRIGAYPTTPPYTPDDLGATVYHALGIDPATEFADRQGQRVQLNRGTVMDVLFSGSTG